MQGGYVRFSAKHNDIIPILGDMPILVIAAASEQITSEGASDAPHQPRGGRAQGMTSSHSTG